ncbi:winged helix-turn-helix domain-containing protein [Argonema galeatum]|uniref:winged helix-turn-helix domain-containing protein n=1 Tax=Argonema galeatum TaxID=2942762 RepID=UPI00201342B3|nr:winged helix-turn-helix domain-containing protein [Argonema galeatum]MCL1468880.1 winged helix-turn-helix domain-containing protein [Argonema galeatum A003/A1]
MNTREKIFRAIVQQPGLTTREIMAIAQLSRTNTREHLQKLESLSLIYSQLDANNPNKHRYYPVGGSEETKI